MCVFFELKHGVSAAAMTSTGLTLEEPTEDGDTPLTLAAEAGLVDAVTVLLQHGASPHNTNSRNESPLLIGSTNTHAVNSKGLFSSLCLFHLAKGSFHGSVEEQTRAR